MRVYDYQMFNGGDLSQATLISGPADLDSMYGYAMQATFTGNAVGTITIEGSCDPVYDLQKNTIVNWSTINVNPLTAPGSMMLNIDAAHYKWMRVVYTRTSGSGSLLINVHYKGF